MLKKLALPVAATLALAGVVSYAFVVLVPPREESMRELQTRPDVSGIQTPERGSMPAVALSADAIEIRPRSTYPNLKTVGRHDIARTSSEAGRFSTAQSANADTPPESNEIEFAAGSGGGISRQWTARGATRQTKPAPAAALLSSGALREPVVPKETKPPAAIAASSVKQKSPDTRAEIPGNVPLTKPHMATTQAPPASEPVPVSAPAVPAARPRSKSPFTPEEERFRAQYGWQAFADRMRENALNPPPENNAR